MKKIIIAFFTLALAISVNTNCDLLNPPLDMDSDGINNSVDNCTEVPNPNQADSDGDQVGNVCDNCSNVSNSNQVDSNNDGVGDACEVASSGIEDAINSISKAKIKEFLYWLADDARRGRLPGDDEDTLNYIENKFREAGLSAVNGSFRQKFVFYDDLFGLLPEVSEVNTANIVGMLKGNDPDLKDEIIVIGAHHDHGGVWPDGVMNGADDNASGTVGVINAAFALSQVKSELKRTVLFMTFGAEEWGLIGSKYYCSNPLLPLNKTVYMINLDMIGYYSTNGLDFRGGNNSDVVAPIIDNLLYKYTSLNGQLTNDSGGGSDHVPFRDNNVPVVALHTGLHDCYHKACDDSDKIDYNGLTQILKLATELTFEVAQNEESPRNERYIQPHYEGADLYDHGVAPFKQFLY